MNSPHTNKRQAKPTALSLEVPISVQGQSLRGDHPLTLSVPFPKGMVDAAVRWNIVSDSGCPSLVQHRVLSTWPDGSVKWLQTMFMARQLGLSKTIENCSAVLVPCSAKENRETSEPQIRVQQNLTSVSVSTGIGSFTLSVGEVLLASTDEADDCWLSKSGCRIVCHDRNKRQHVANWSELKVIESGPLRATITASGRLGRTGLKILASVSFHAGSNLMRAEITVANNGRAKHSQGYWDLGDSGSVLLNSLSFEVETQGRPDREIVWREQADGPSQSCVNDDLEIYQDSSGGENWQSLNHVNRNGEVPLRFCGYRVRTGDHESHGRRANPLVAIVENDRYFAFAMEEFWEKFPSAMEVNRDKVQIHLWPGQSGDLHELQGGERNSRVVWMDFGNATETPWGRLTGIHQKPVAIVDPTWIASSRALPFFPKPDVAKCQQLQSVLDDAIAGENGFFAKRETIDEFGWRNFGDTWADHEEAFAEDPSPIVSHYNNQYDLLHGMLVQFLQTGDERWWHLADPLARHVMTIDIYHTKDDKSAYNGGMFWHTAHYHAAATSSHRCFSSKMDGKSIPAGGGGPANEHSYSGGLLLYYFLTGNIQARDAVIGIADWVIAMDDGKQHLLGVASDSPTGLATCTRELQFQGPGRGAGNSILALTNGWMASGKSAYLEKANELIRRTINPSDDVAARKLLDAEERWSYTVYLQVLCTFVELIDQVNGQEYIQAYARNSVLHYAQWMLDHEQLYMNRPDELEYPTETWPAQDLRKGVVLLMAAAFEENESQREKLRRKGAEILAGAWCSLMSFTTRTCTRPVAIVLQQCYVDRFFTEPENHESMLNRKLSRSFDCEPATEFIPQKIIVKQQLKSPLKLLSLVMRLARPRSWVHVAQQTWMFSRVRNFVRIKK